MVCKVLPGELLKTLITYPPEYGPLVLVVEWDPSLVVIHIIVIVIDTPLNELPGKVWGGSWGGREDKEATILARAKKFGKFMSRGVKDGTFVDKLIAFPGQNRPSIM